MRKIVISFIVVMLLLFALPLILVKTTGVGGRASVQSATPAALAGQAAASTSGAQKPLADGEKATSAMSNGDVARYAALENIKVYVSKLDVIEDMQMEEYLKGVLAAEMPVSFDIEALKAQAVAARTFAANRALVARDVGAPPQYKGADICTDYHYCQAYMSKDEAMAGWGTKAAEYWSKIEQAVLGTKGQIITYNNTPISAVFFDMSSGKTENAEDVWGAYIPYLRSIDVPGDPLVPKFNTSVEVTFDEFSKKIKGINASAKPDKAKPNIERSEAGGIKTISIGGVNFKGTEIRTAFGLRSTNFTIAFDKDTVKFDVRGNGHGVGMSQYGADYFAKNGMKYDEIIKKFYQGVEIKKEI